MEEVDSYQRMAWEINLLRGQAWPATNVATTGSGAPDRSLGKDGVFEGISTPEAQLRCELSP